MRFASAIILSTVLCYGLHQATAQSPSSGVAPASASASASFRGAAGPTQSDIQGLRDQVQKMKVLVQQMEQNLAFVGTAQSPLKHQFQLEIDMWKTVIEEMEKKLNSSGRP